MGQKEGGKLLEQTLNEGPQRLFDFNLCSLLNCFLPDIRCPVALNEKALHPKKDILLQGESTSKQFAHRSCLMLHQLEQLMDATFR